MYPYDSMRDYVAELEKRNRFIRIKEIDQDLYESTALIYKMLERMGDKAPGFFAERTKINNKWFETPVVGNIYNGYDTIALSFGVQDVTDVSIDMHSAAVDRIQTFLQPDGTWKEIPPVEVKIPTAAAIPATSSGDVSWRNKITVLPFFFHASASSAVKTT